MSYNYLQNINIDNNNPIYTTTGADDSNEADPKQEQQFLFDNKNDAQYFLAYLKLRLPEDADVHLDPVKSDSGDFNGYQVTLSSDPQNPISLSLNDDQELTISIGKDSTIRIPNNISADLIATGSEETQAFLKNGDTGSNQDQSAAGKLWGKLSAQFKDQINPVGDWAIGDSVNFEGSALDTINEAKSNIDHKLTDAGIDPNELDATIVKYAASKGFLDDGAIQEHEASEIASYLQSDEFEASLTSNESTKDGLIAIIQGLHGDQNPRNVQPDPRDPPPTDPPPADPKPKVETAPEMTDTQKLYFDNRGTFQTITKCWTRWAAEKGFDDKVSIKDLNDIAKDTKRPQEERDAAQFLIDHSEITDQMDTAKKGGDKDDKISTGDLAIWMKNNDIFGKRFTYDNSADLTNLANNWHAISRGDDQITIDDIKYVLSDPVGKDGKHEFTEQQIKAAQFLKDNPDYHAYLDLYGTGLDKGYMDGKVGLEDFSQISDGLITTNFDQPTNGNCWVLSGLYSLARTDKGAAALDNCIEKGNDGNYYVTFPGDPKHEKYQITPEDIQNSKYVNQGKDIDMQVLNIGVEKFLKNNPNFDGLGTDILDGGFTSSINKLIMGSNESVNDSEKNSIDWFKQNADAINNGDMSVTIGAEVDTSTGDFKPGTDAMHAFVITGVDTNTNTIKYINPWNPGTEREISFEDFQKLYGTKDSHKPQINYVDNTA